MFEKYVGQLGNCEAECVKEVLDMHAGDEMAARRAVTAALIECMRIDKIRNAAYVEWCEESARYRRQRFRRFLLRAVGRGPQPPVPFDPKPYAMPEFAGSVYAIAFATGGRWWYDGLVSLGLVVKGEKLQPLND